jgi:hypothetical protein
MRSLIRSLVFAAAGFAAASLYRQWSSDRRASPRGHRHPLENWENEGGALPDVASADGRPATQRAAPNSSPNSW